MKPGLSQRLRSCQIVATSSTSCGPQRASSYHLGNEYLTSRGKPMNEHQQNLMSKSINHTNSTPNGLWGSQVTCWPFSLLSTPHQATESSTLTKGHATTARIMRKPGALPQSGLSSSGPRRLKLVAAALHRSHRRHHYCCCLAGAAGGDGDSPVGAVGLLSLLLGRL